MLHYGWVLSSVSRCLELVMKHIVQVFDVFSNGTIRNYDMFSLVCIICFMSCVNQQNMSFKCKCLISDEKHVSCQMKTWSCFIWCFVRFIHLI